MIEVYRTNLPNCPPVAADGATLRRMSPSIFDDWGSGPGEVRDERVEVEIEPVPVRRPALRHGPRNASRRVQVTQASGATVFDLASTRSRGAVHALPRLRGGPGHGKAREVYDPTAPPADALRSDYVVDGRLDVGAWARDAVGLALPEQILCRPECAGLCPVCGKDLNVEPHEHIELETDPRWAPLEELRDRL